MKHCIETGNGPSMKDINCGMMEQATDTKSGLQTCTNSPWTTVDWEEVRRAGSSVYLLRKYESARHIFRLAAADEPGGQWRKLTTNATEVVVTGDPYIPPFLTHSRIVDVRFG